VHEDEVHTIAWKRAYQGQGIGRRLMESWEISTKDGVVTGGVAPKKEEANAL